MSIRNKIIFISLLTVLFVVFIPKGTAQAALPTILPNCDRTCYTVTKTSDSTTIPGGDCVYDPKEYENNDMYTLYPHIDSKCGFNDFVQLLINLGSWGLAILAVLALLLFIYGGFMLILAGGETQKIQSGKKILLGTFIGVIIVLLAWNVVGFFVTTLAGNETGLIFPEESFPSVLWWGGQGCRNSWPTCNANNLHENCSDGKTKLGDITQLQNQLNELGCGCGTADGCFGTITKACVIKFQDTWNATKTPALKNDGVADKSTQDAILIADIEGIKCK